VVAALQQVLAFESDLLEYDDIFDGSHVVEAKVAELVEGAKAEIDRVQAMGGAVAAVESGYMKQAARRLAAPPAARRIESGEEVVVGVNKFETTEPSPLTADLDAAIRPPTPRPSRPRSPRSRSGGAARRDRAVDRGAGAAAADAKTDRT
jgi:(2R)-ethylmalonyl-CoA mutase